MNQYMRKVARPVFAGIMMIGGLAMSAGRCEAAIVSGTSRAYNESVSITGTVLGAGATLSSGPLSLAQGTAPAAYNNTSSLPTASAGLSTGSLNLGAATATLSPINLSLAGLTSTASSDVNGSLGSKTTSATSQATGGLNFSLFDTTLSPIVGPSVSLAGLSITATSFVVSAMVQGDYGALTRTSSAYVENLLIKSGGLTVYSYTGLLAPETVINTSLSTALGGAALSILLNHQVVTGNGISSGGISTSLISIQLANTGVSALGVPLAALSGNITIGQAEASMAAVPEPASLAMVGCGLIGVVGVAARRRMKLA